MDPFLMAGLSWLRLLACGEFRFATEPHISQRRGGPENRDGDGQSPGLLGWSSLLGGIKTKGRQLENKQEEGRVEADPQPLRRSTVRGRDEQSQVQCSSRLIYQGLKFMIF